jgi:hypothetical protein
LRFQVRLSGQGWAGNSGVQIRSTLIDPAKYIVRGPQCDMGKGYWGSLYGERSGGMMKQADWEVGDRTVKEGQFNNYYIRCIGKHVTIKVNDVTTVDDRFPQLPEEGIIAWQLHGGKPMTVTFRNVEFRELNLPKGGKTGAEAVEEQEEAEATQESPFFNGKNLFGWQGLPGYWRVRDGAIVGAPADGVKAHTFLCSEKTYGDFELKFKVKRKGGIGNSGVQIRSRIDNRERFTVVGPQIEIDSANFRYPPGSLVTEPVGPYVKAKAAAVASVWKDDDFNAMTIRCKGKWVRVTINGVEVLNSRFPSLPDEGIIAWQLHGGNGAVAPEEVVFKDIHFTDLGRKQTTSAGRLFHDGLTGWIREGGYRKTWQIRDGEVIGTATNYLNSGFLLSPRAYSNFRLRFQYQLSAGANSGVAIRAQPGETDPLSHVPQHLEVQLLDDDTYRETKGVQDCFTGALFWSSRSNVSSCNISHYSGDISSLGSGLSVKVCSTTPKSFSASRWRKARRTRKRRRSQW